MTRIRYNNFGPTTLVTNTVFVGNGKMLVGYIETNLLTLKIMDSEGKIQYGGIADSVSHAKKLMKEELILLGVQFVDEVRKKKNVISISSAA